MKPLEFYYLALELARDATTEARQRTIVGRLYYGLHHEACCRLFREYPQTRPLRRNGRHTDLLDRYTRLRTDSALDVARLLRRLSAMRNEADYQLEHLLRFNDRSYSADELMGLALAVSRRLLAALESFSPGEAPDGCACPTVYSSG